MVPKSLWEYKQKAHWCLSFAFVFCLHHSDSTSDQLSVPLSSILENTHFHVFTSPDQELEKPIDEVFSTTTAGGRRFSWLSLGPYPSHLCHPSYLNLYFTQLLNIKQLCKFWSQSLRSSRFSMECDWPHHLTACLHFAFLYQRLWCLCAQ